MPRTTYDSLTRSVRLVPTALAVCVALVAACATPVDDSRLSGDDITSGKKAPTKKKKAPTEEDTTEETPGTEGEEKAPDPGPPASPSASAPTLSSVAPDAVTIGAAPQGVDLTVTGTGFVAGTKVDLAGTVIVPTITSETELKVRIPGDKLNASGTLRLSVVGPNAESNALTFTIANPTSVVIQTLAPQNTLVAGAAVTLQINGSGFIPSSQVKFNGAALTTTFTSATRLSATVPTNAISAAGRYSVTVSSGTDVISLPSSFEVRNALPRITTGTPVTAEQGSAAIVVTIDGSGFAQGSQALAGTAPLATTFVSSTRLRATLPSAAFTTAGTMRLTVQTPAPGGGTSAQLAFTVTAKAAAACSSGYTCAEYSYKANDCQDGWQCDAAGKCLVNVVTCPAATPAATCKYTCAEYKYTPGQCYKNYVCNATGANAGCLTATTLCP